MSLLVLALVATLGAPPAFDYVLEPGAHSVIQRLMAVPDGAPKGTRAEGAQIKADHVIFSYALGDAALVTIELRHAKSAQKGDILLDGLSVRTNLNENDPLLGAFLKTLRGLASKIPFRARAKQGMTSNPLKVARAKLYMLDKEGVKKAVLDVVAAAPDDPQLRVEVALILHAAGLVEDAKNQRAEALRRLIDGPETLSAQVALETLDGAPDETRISEVLAFGPNGACGLSRVVDAYYLSERYDPALAIVDRILKVAPKCTDAHHLGAEVAARKLDWADLLARVIGAEKALGSTKDFTIHRATALRGLKRYDEARDLVEAVVRANPQSSGALAMLTNLYNLTMTKEEVFRDLKARYEGNAKDLVSHYLAGVMAHYLGRHKDCVEILEPLIAKMPTEPRVSMYAAVSAHFVGEQAKAEKLIAIAHGIAGAMDPDVFYCRSIIVRKKDMAMAIGDLERFLTVARFGWHSEGKIKRVQGELDQLRAGIIPPPAEPHHRLQPEPDAKAETETKEAAEPADADDGEAGVWGNSTKGALAMIVLLLLLFVGWRRVAGKSKTT